MNDNQLELNINMLVKTGPLRKKNFFEAEKNVATKL